ncbi:MAG: prolipoprotein diacylglyceryl transferase [Elusimicrobiota bacterium]
MFPELLRLGPVTLHTYGALVALGFFLGYTLTVKLAGRRGVPAETVLGLAWVALLAGLAGARLLYVALNWGYFKTAPLEIFQLWAGGLVWYGGFLAAGTAGAFWARRRGVPVKIMADAAAPGVALGHAFGRLGCFAAGCCYGHPWDGWCAVTFRHPAALAPRGIPLHPSQLYEAGLNFALFAFLAAWSLRRPGDLGTGRLAAAYAIFYSVIRLAVEATRGDDRGPLLARMTPTEWLAFVILLAASAWWFRRGRSGSRAPGA